MRNTTIFVCATMIERALERFGSDSLPGDLSVSILENDEYPSDVKALIEGREQSLQLLSELLTAIATGSENYLEIGPGAAAPLFSPSTQMGLAFYRSSTLTAGLSVRTLQPDDANRNRPYILIEGNAASLTAVADLTITAAEGEWHYVSIGPKAAGSSVFSKASPLGLYIHRLGTGCNADHPGRS